MAIWESWWRNRHFPRSHGRGIALTEARGPQPVQLLTLETIDGLSKVDSIQNERLTGLSKYDEEDVSPGLKVTTLQR